MMIIIMPPSYGRSYKAMLQSVCPSLQLLFSNSPPFTLWRYMQVTASSALERWQHSRSNAISSRHIASPHVPRYYYYVPWTNRTCWGMYLWQLASATQNLPSRWLAAEHCYSMGQQSAACYNSQFKSTHRCLITVNNRNQVVKNRKWRWTSRLYQWPQNILPHSPFLSQS